MLSDAQGVWGAGLVPAARFQSCKATGWGQSESTIMWVPARKGGYAYGTARVRFP